MEEPFKRSIEKKIDSAVDRAIESSDEEKEKLAQQAERLRKSLKESILQEAVLDEDRITEDEWQEIYDALPKDLLEAFRIHQLLPSSSSSTSFFSRVTLKKNTTSPTLGCPIKVLFPVRMITP